MLSIGLVSVGKERPFTQLRCPERRSELRSGFTDHGSAHSTPSFDYRTLLGKVAWEALLRRDSSQTPRIRERAALLFPLRKCINDMTIQGAPTAVPCLRRPARQAGVQGGRRAPLPDRDAQHRVGWLACLLAWISSGSQASPSDTFETPLGAPPGTDSRSSQESSPPTGLVRLEVRVDFGAR